MTLIGTACPTRSERVLVQSADNEVVLLHLDAGTYFALNEVGGRIWELCDGSQTLGQIVSILAAEFDAPTALIQEDASALLQELAADDLIRF